MWAEPVLISSELPSSVWLILREWLRVMKYLVLGYIFRDPGIQEPINIPSSKYMGKGLKWDTTRVNIGPTSVYNTNNDLVATCEENITLMIMRRCRLLAYTLVTALMTHKPRTWYHINNAVRFSSSADYSFAEMTVKPTYKNLTVTESSTDPPAVPTTHPPTVN